MPSRGGLTYYITAYLSKIVEMLSGYTYFRWISMISSPFSLFLQSKIPFSMVNAFFSGNTICLRSLAMKGCGVILPGLNF